MEAFDFPRGYRPATATAHRGRAGFPELPTEPVYVRVQKSRRGTRECVIIRVNPNLQEPHSYGGGGRRWCAGFRPDFRKH